MAPAAQDLQTTIPRYAPAEEASLSRGVHHPTLAEIQSDPISLLAQKKWLKKMDWNPAVVEQIYKEQLEATKFNTRKVMLLEFNQYLEKFLWPNYDPETSSLPHILSIVLMINEKFRQRVPAWDFIQTAPVNFSRLFSNIVRLTLPSHSQNLTLQTRKFLILFLVNAFQSLENVAIRSECMRLVSIATWECIVPKRRERLFNENPSLRKVWKHIQKKYDTSDEATREKLDFERKWLSNLLRDFVQILFSIEDSNEDTVFYCERFVELLIDLEAQLPTRRYFNTLLDDHQILILCENAPILKHMDKSSLLMQLLDILRFYAKFEINDYQGTALTRNDMREIHESKLVELQRIAFKHFQPTLKSLALSNVGSIEQRDELLNHFKELEDSELMKLAEMLGVRTEIVLNDTRLDEHQILLDSLVARFEKRVNQIDTINSMPIYPDENMLFNDVLVKTQFYSGDRPLALPKLNLQFLTIHDYLLRNFNLFRLESAYEIRQDIEDVVKRLGPRVSVDNRTAFSGWARMAVPITGFQVVEVAGPKVGENKPAYVKADITLNLGRYTDSIRAEWDELRQHDVLFLLTIEAHAETSEKYTSDMDFRKHFGIKYVRGCEMRAFIGDDGKPLDEGEPRDENALIGSVRTIRVHLDPNQYKADMDRHHKEKKENVHETFNLLLRRKPKENNFKSVLETIRDLMQSELVIPDWLHNVFLGYGDPGSAHYSRISNQPKELNFRDTFLDYEHLVESFPNSEIVPSPESTIPVPPPHILSFPQTSEDRKTSKKRKANAQPPVTDGAHANNKQVAVRTYTMPNMGPYPFNKPKQNSIRFTPVQIEAIRAGMSPGLTLIVGPPGTGKTDVAVQIIANIYHNNPEQHTLLITHSNQALNQLFEKIMALDIDERHLLRLGHGEEELNTELSFSKYGRVNSFLEKRLELLAEVDRLAKSLDIGGAHGYTCETAGYFFLYHVLARWEKYTEKVKNGPEESLTAELVRDEFPFAEYFANAPQPLFPAEASYLEALEIAEGCFRHINHIFTQLNEIRAFELLRTGHDRSNYLLTKEAKIIAMTCTHAALKRRELTALGFKYDNVIMEEAAQILEVETFVPLLLQEPDGDHEGRNRLKRVVLIGDHNQLPPVVKNLAFQQYGNMEQSMFTRFVRLGVPHIQLDRQGRARSSIAGLYRWRYNGLGDLPIIKEAPEYQKANAGFSFEYQLINVEDYNGAGESEPSPYFYQNLGEAEYVVALYQYMRLLGYPSEKISILTTYNGQKALIRDVLQRRCSWHPLFGWPACVSTVDKYQGQQNDYVLLSLVRTKTVGYLRDVRRLVVALSRARLGLYVFCRRALFENCVEMREAFSLLVQRGDKLSLRLGEMWPTDRAATPADAEELQKDEQGVIMEDVKHMGSYIHQMIQEQLEHARQLQEEREREEQQRELDAMEEQSVEPQTEQALEGTEEHNEDGMDEDRANEDEDME
ncbi:uncharacterized protein VTP21DRAFT_2398 [Calcarisporiella thermophila]|uniref:uncharacterized protein n=1 Tax=Calcarisporiella thermophila TaxID=911321 RepID=UPI003744B0EB